VPVAVTCSSFVTTPGDPLIVGSIRDISTEEGYLAQIRRLTADAESKLEAEKAEIARELHDELGQLLTVLNLDLAWVSRRIGQTDASIRDRVAQMRDITNEVTERVRHLSKSLHPPVLEHEGLAATIQWQAAEFERRAGIPCRVTIKPPDLGVAERLAVTVFRIVQEALTNVARHAHATRCEVSLVLHRGMLEVVVSDNGVGAAPARLAGSDSLGMTAMRERAAAAGGTVHVESRPGSGVRVTARWPSRKPHKPRGS
jgi:signal transduction histidine kinase